MKVIILKLSDVHSTTEKRVEMSRHLNINTILLNRITDAKNVQTMIKVHNIQVKKKNTCKTMSHIHKTRASQMPKEKK